MAARPDNPEMNIAYAASGETVLKPDCGPAM
ncbi:hypothetical protein EDE08_109345 [Bradyrhizobium sp. R2.2-H]|jgi:hypothetical protein|nr:hypothetical protein EDE10_10968 [Bradyrhizobium sp. Y-H1]TCU70122.1 hypothetical protein EDE08_109345 [Bradyrhizobium sp. R2.2-H]